MSRKLDAPQDQKRTWDRRAKELAARLGFKDHSARALTSRIAQAVWRRAYYADQPQMISPQDHTYSLPDVLDALRLIPAALYAVGVDERDLIRAARHMGATWEEIGICLGAAATGARQTARGRYQRLGGDVHAAVVGRAVEQAPTLVAAPPPTQQPARRPWPAPAADWPLPGDRTIPGVAFVAPKLFDDGDDQ